MNNWIFDKTSNFNDNYNILIEYNELIISKFNKDQRHV